MRGARAGTGERSESIRLMFGGEDVMDVASLSARVQLQSTKKVVRPGVHTSLDLNQNFAFEFDLLSFRGQKGT